MTCTSNVVRNEWHALVYGLCMFSYVHRNVTQYIFARTYSWYSLCNRGDIITFLIARFIGPTWGPYGADRTQVGPMLAPWTSLFGMTHYWTSVRSIYQSPWLPSKSSVLHSFGVFVCLSRKQLPNLQNCLCWVVLISYTLTLALRHRDVHTDVYHCLNICLKHNISHKDAHMSYVLCRVVVIVWMALCKTAVTPMRKQ